MTGIRNRIIITGDRDREMFLWFQIEFVAQASARTDVIRVHRLHAQGVLLPNGIGDRTINNSSE